MKVKMKGIKMNLVGDLVAKGDSMSFSATKTNFLSFKLDKLKGWKVISVFPSINTRVCDEQTKNIIELAKEFPKVNFVSISLDLPPAQKEWCVANGFKNISIVSDYKEREFGIKYGLLIDKLKLLARAIIVVNKENVVHELIMDPELSNMPDFSHLKNILKEI